MNQLMYIFDAYMIVCVMNVELRLCCVNTTSVNSNTLETASFSKKSAHLENRRW